MKIVYKVEYRFPVSGVSHGHLFFRTLEEAESDTAKMGTAFDCRIIRVTTVTTEEVVSCVPSTSSSR